MPKQILLNLTLKCGKYKKEVYDKKTVSEVKEIVETFFKEHLEYDYKLSYNVLTNLLTEGRPKNPILTQFINIEKYKPIVI